MISGKRSLHSPNSSVRCQIEQLLQAVTSGSGYYSLSTIQEAVLTGAIEYIARISEPPLSLRLFRDLADQEMQLRVRRALHLDLPGATNPSFPLAPGDRADRHASDHPMPLATSSTFGDEVDSLALLGLDRLH